MKLTCSILATLFSVGLVCGHGGGGHGFGGGGGHGFGGIGIGFGGVGLGLGGLGYGYDLGYGFGLGGYGLGGYGDYFSSLFSGPEEMGIFGDPYAPSFMTGGYDNGYGDNSGYNQGSTNNAYSSDQQQPATGGRYKRDTAGMMMFPANAGQRMPTVQFRPANNGQRVMQPMMNNQRPVRNNQRTFVNRPRFVPNMNMINQGIKFRN